MNHASRGLSGSKNRSTPAAIIAREPGGDMSDTLIRTVAFAASAQAGAGQHVAQDAGVGGGLRKEGDRELVLRRPDDLRPVAGGAGGQRDDVAGAQRLRDGPERGPVTALPVGTNEIGEI